MPNTKIIEYIKFWHNTPWCQKNISHLFIKKCQYEPNIKSINMNQI